jgi:flagellar motor switch protein FliN/FliY
MAEERSPLSQEEVERMLAQARGQPAAGAAEPAPSGGVRQEEIDALLKAATGQTPQPTPSAAPRAADAFEGSIAPADLEYLLNQADQAIASIDGSAKPGIPPGVAPFSLPELAGAPASTESATLDLIRDVELDLRIELGRTHMYLEDVLRLGKGAVVPLDKLAGDPVDIYVNGRLIARGEVLVLNDNFCVRVAELISGEAQS